MSDGRERRSPLFAGLLLILLGFVFLIDRFYPHFGLGHLIRLYWPVLVILWGVAKLVDHVSAQRSGEPRGPLLSGAEAALLILLVLVLGAFVFRDWIRNEFPGLDIHLNLPGFERSFSRTRSLPPIEIPAGAHVSIETARGDIKIVGVEGDELRVNVRSSATERNEGAAADTLIDRVADGYRIHPANRGGGWRDAATVDFDVQVPKMAAVAASTSHGDVSASGVAGSLETRTESGDVRIRNAGSSVQVGGRGDDVDVAGVSGDVTLDGAFLGDIRVRKVAGTLHIKSPRADVTVAQFSGDLTLDSGDLSISGATSPIKVATRDKDVTVQDAAAKLDVADSHGDITVRFAKPPRENVSITNDSGDVSLSLPAQSAFQISALSRSGEIECDFEDPALRRAQDTQVERLNGTFGAPSGVSVPKISIATSYGAVHVTKSK